MNYTVNIDDGVEQVHHRLITDFSKSLCQNQCDIQDHHIISSSLKRIQFTGSLFLYLDMERGLFSVKNTEMNCCSKDWQVI